MAVVGVLNLAGALAFFVGLFFTIPITAVAAAHVYRILQKRLEPEPIEQRAAEIAETAFPSLSTKSSP